jgi:hypothetical protein
MLERSAMRKKNLHESANPHRQSAFFMDLPRPPSRADAFSTFDKSFTQPVALK